MYFTIFYISLQNDLSLVYICHSIILQLFFCLSHTVITMAQNGRLKIFHGFRSKKSPASLSSICAWYLVANTMISVFFYDFWWIFCRCPWWNLLPLLHQHGQHGQHGPVWSGPWPPLHAPTPHLQGEFCARYERLPVEMTV